MNSRANERGQSELERRAHRAERHLRLVPSPPVARAPSTDPLPVGDSKLMAGFAQRVAQWLRSTTENDLRAWLAGGLIPTAVDTAAPSTYRPVVPTAAATETPRISRFDHEWHAFLGALQEHGVSPDHHAYVLERSHELAQIRASEPHIEVVDAGAVVFTWNDGRNYLNLTVAAGGDAQWFFDDGVHPRSGTCAATQDLPPEFRTCLGAMGS